MQNLRVLERKSRKLFMESLRKTFGFEGKLDYYFLTNNKNKIFIVNKKINEIDIAKIRVNSIGLYIAEFSNNEARLSIEGSQIIGPEATRNVVELDEKKAREWIKGRDIETKAKAKGFVILRCGDDYLGSGRVKEGRILNFVPKARRLNASD
ncbi:hypothetical protein KY358_02555 [Candidatus Woesearchaeota archaeon]|nr:hypothetical protein [Candidatus Woesearchaeota archaeon]